MCCKLYICLDKLSPEERDLINRIYFLGYSLRQLSVETGIPYMTIQHRKVKILAKLKKTYGKLKFFSYNYGLNSPIRDEGIFSCRNENF